MAQRLIEAHEDASLALQHGLAAGSPKLATSEIFASCLMPPILRTIRTTFLNIEVEIR